MTRRIWMNPASDSAELRAIVKAANPGARIMGRAPDAFRSEPTPVGDQLLIPGCEKRQNRDGSAPKQATLWEQ